MLPDEGQHRRVDTIRLKPLNGGVAPWPWLSFKNGTLEDSWTALADQPNLKDLGESGQVGAARLGREPGRIDVTPSYPFRPSGFSEFTEELGDELIAQAGNPTPFLIQHRPRLKGSQRRPPPLELADDRQV
jgi:hypothetical protein